MIIASFVAHIQDRLAKRSLFNRLVREIESLTERDLADLRADRADLLHGVYRQVYG